MGQQRINPHCRSVPRGQPEQPSAKQKRGTGGREKKHSRVLASRKSDRPADTEWRKEPVPTKNSGRFYATAKARKGDTTQSQPQTPSSHLFFYRSKKKRTFSWRSARAQKIAYGSRRGKKRRDLCASAKEDTPRRTTTTTTKRPHGDPLLCHKEIDREGIEKKNRP